MLIFREVKNISLFKKKNKKEIDPYFRPSQAKKVFTQKNNANLLSLLKSKKIIIFAIIALVIIISGVAAVLVCNNNNNKQAKVIDKTAIIKSVKSNVSVETSELLIKEWKIKMPINANILGTVSYKMINENKLVFSSSKLNETDLSKAECSGVNKGSWGLNRLEVGNNPNPVTKYNYLPNYLIGHVRPSSLCAEVKEIYAAFSYMMQYIEGA